MTEVQPNWEGVFELVGAALEVGASQRPGFLARSGADAWTQAEAASLLAMEANGSCEVLDNKLEHLLREAAKDELLGPEPSCASNLSGRVIGKYRVIRELSSGGMGTVYLAERADGEFEQIVALKLMSSVLPVRGLLKRFHAERQMLARLRHPHIAQLLDGGTTPEGWPYLVMEYIEGTDVCTYADDQRLTTWQRLELFLHICAAVQAAHQSLIVHCDLKPGNVLVTPEGFPKLLDFGIARALAETRQELSSDSSEGGWAPPAQPLISSAQFALTPAYASPEQLNGEMITTSSDVYSLGVLLCVLLAGVSPFDPGAQGAAALLPSRTALAPSLRLNRRGDKVVLERLGRSRKTTAMKLRQQLEGDLDAIVLKALQNDPKNRYASVEQLAQDIRAHLELRPVAAHARTRRYRYGRFFARNRLAVLSAAALLLTCAMGTAAVAWQARRAERERERAVRRFNDVRGVAYTILFELSDAVRNLPGSTQTETLLARRASEFLTRMAQDAGSDPAFMRELATSYRKLGTVQGYPYTHNIGDTQSAAQSFRAAIHWGELAQQQEPSDLKSRKELAEAYDELGSTLAVGKESLDAFAQAIRMDDALMRSHPERDDFARALALDYQHVSGPLRSEGRLNDALGSLEKSYALSERLLREHPGDQTSMNILSFTCKRLGAIQIMQEHWDAALAAYTRSLALDQASGHGAQPDARKAYDSTFAYDDIGYIYWHRGDPRAGLRWYEKSLAIRQAAALADTTNLRSAGGVATVQAYMGQILTSTHEWPKALIFERDVYNARERLDNEAHRFPDTQLDLFDAEFRLAKTYQLWEAETRGKDPSRLSGEAEWRSRAERSGHDLLTSSALHPPQSAYVRERLQNLTAGTLPIF